MAYMDDIMIKSVEWNEHLVHLEKAFQAVLRKQVKTKASKVHLGQTKVVFLGFHVTQDGITIDPGKTEKIRDLPAPRDEEASATSSWFFCHIIESLCLNFSKKSRSDRVDVEERCSSEVVR